MERYKVVGDILEQCAAVGELHHALEQGIISQSDVHGEIGAIVAGAIPGRENDDENIVYDAAGTALQDTAAAASYYEKTVKFGKGCYRNLFE
ncbi:hypothetical protein CSA56_00515 [candidate division KSB3 bacterium]|uniref:Ornithine cyclodeaminase n=1 Tax=candidate division KSB3 bacterium TaxID=2044937 RepID=A0A2G6KKU8_9BACT|nr:MAG: hypothetical protein CSA56_00515 [candidate division KSB3 bacterium]